MPKTEAQRRAYRKWQQDARQTLGCTVKASIAQDFIRAAATNNTNTNALLTRFVLDYIEANKNILEDGGRNG